MGLRHELARQLGSRRPDEGTTLWFTGGAAMRWVICGVILSILLPCLVSADGSYRIGKDKGGLYMETDRNGSWYIDPNHVRDFSVGETGQYVVKTDPKGTYIQTPRGVKYYINWKARESRESERRAAADKPPAAEGLETRVNLLEGTHVLVPVTIGSKGRQIQVSLLLDTGASIMVLHQEIADRLKLKGTSKAKLMTAGGKLIDTDIVRLDFVGVGPIQRQGLDAGVIQHAGPGVTYQGLLGMNFLKGLDYRIDYKRQAIRWNP
jgi:clan AA aspartic protease (TIGR02281 family)